MSHANYHEIVLSDKLAKLVEKKPKKFQKILDKIDTSALDLKRGDVVGLVDYPGYGYRNDGKVMWDGQHLVQLTDEIDDYGQVPPIFVVGREFDNAKYWQHDVQQSENDRPYWMIEHNNFVYASFDKSHVSDIITLSNHFHLFKYTRGNSVELWTIFTNNIDRYFETTPVLSYSCDDSFIDDLSSNINTDLTPPVGVDISRILYDNVYITFLDMEQIKKEKGEEDEEDDDEDEEDDDEDEEDDDEDEDEDEEDDDEEDDEEDDDDEDEDLV
jgi:hypothetical protein